MKTEKTLALQTRAVHAGEPERRPGAPITTPVYHSSMFLTGELGRYDDIKYMRSSNMPNHEAVARKLADLEGGEVGLVTATGMSAITSALFAVLGKGGHLIAQNSLYGGTQAFVTHDFPDLGLACTFVDATRADGWESALRPGTKAIYVESMTNPRLDVADLEGVVRFARAHGLVSIIDNTFATPVNFRPLEHGFDLVLHSATKYLNGHSDLVAGVVIGSAKLVEQVRHKLIHLGGSADPHACFLLQRGVKTLTLRVDAQNRNALEIAAWLERHPRVASVHYPGLASHPQHDRARTLFAGFGGMTSFELKADASEADAFLRRLRLVVHTVSLGGVETLATRPAATSHAGLSAEERQKAGVADGLIRLSVGIESPADVIADLEQALAGVKG
ncbi:MAG: aminotransferase class I/II-fold pyridoxal phosphate-dependent enzyme [Vicinamibacteria bacterium]